MKIQWESITDFAKAILRKMDIASVAEVDRMRDSLVRLGHIHSLLMDDYRELYELRAQRLYPIIARPLEDIKASIYHDDVSLDYVVTLKARPVRLSVIVPNDQLMGLVRGGRSEYARHRAEQMIQDLGITIAKQNMKELMEVLIPTLKA